MYLRLSKDDDNDTNESNSINNQRELIKLYANKNDMDVVLEYVDDGYSGANFERPAFKNMIADLNEWKFNTIIVKDLSRFGRDYIESGKYLQQIFPRMGVRFISINDCYDSYNANLNERHFVLPIKNFLNDSYCRDISIKVKSSKRSKQDRGEFIGSFAPYGYKKDTENKYRFIIDKGVSHIIEKIFDMKIEGYSSRGIAEYLNTMGYETPLKYKNKCMNSKMKCYFDKGIGKWFPNIINRIITNRVYIGVMEQCKTVKLNHKSNKRIVIDKHNWISKLNTHERIISNLKFELANKMLLRDLRGNPNILSGLLFCKNCKRKLIKKVRMHKNTEKIFYLCSKKNKCIGCKIEFNQALNLIKEIVFKYVKTYSDLIDKIKHIDIKNIDLDYKCKDLIEERNKYEKIKKSLYKDLEDNIINEKEFDRFSVLYRKKINDLDEKIKSKRELLNYIKNEIYNDRFSFNYKNNELNRYVLVSLIDKIEVGNEYDINIVFNDYNKLNLVNEIINNYYLQSEEKVNGKNC